MLWLSLTGRLPTPELWQTCLYLFLAANSQTFFNTGCVVTCVQNFPQNRGVVIGLMKGFLGLSGAILTQIYHGVYGYEPGSYLFMVTWLPSVICLSLMFIIRRVPAAEQRHESTNLYILSAMAVSLAAFLMGVILLESTISVTRTGYVTVSLVICGILLLPLGVLLKSELEEAETSSIALRQPLLISNEIEPSSLPRSGGSPVVRDVEGGGSHRSQRTLGPTEAEASTGRATKNERLKTSSGGFLLEKAQLREVQQVEKEPSRGEEHTIREAIGKADFWLLFLAMACGMGSGLTAIDNTGQIGSSLGYAAEQMGVFVSLFSIWNFLGRLGFGALSEMCLHRYQTGRPVLLACSQVFMSLGYILISSAIPGSLYPALTIIGLCYGAQWSLMPTITSELFGLSRFATLFNTISVASPLGSYFLSVQVAGRLYDAEAVKEHEQVNSFAHLRWLNSADLECHGAHCFRLTFIILAGVSLFGCSVCVLLALRTKQFYARLLQN